MKLASEILILAMIIFSNSRVFIVRKANIDSLVMLSPLAFVLSILRFFAFGIDLFSVILPLLSLIVLLTNFHAMFRFSSRLIVDRYSPAMKTWAIITSLISVITLIGAIYFSPIELQSNKLGITETHTPLSGNFMGGFREAEKFTIADAHLYEFAPIEESKPKPIIIFAPDKRGDTYHYKPLLQLLAQKGYVCYSADFFAKDARWIHTVEDARLTRRLGLVIRSVTNNRNYMSQREFYTYNFSREFVAMLNLLDKKYNKDVSVVDAILNDNTESKDEIEEYEIKYTGQTYFFVTDELGMVAASDVQKKYPEKVIDIFDISKVDAYKTPGYGFIEKTDPMLAKILGVEKSSDFENVEIIANAITEKFAEYQNNAADTENENDEENTYNITQGENL